MIGQLQNAAFAVCTTLIVTAIFMMLLPSSGANKLVKFAVSLFFLIAIIRPFTGVDFDFDRELERYFSPETAANDMNARIEKQLTTSFEKKLTDEVERILKKHDLVAEKITFSIHIGADKSITITNLKIELNGKDESRSSSAVSEINRQFELTAEVAFIE